jgi:predicted XRE-type DNA-binding protein
MTQQLLTQAAVAKILGVRKDTVGDLVNKLQIPTHKIPANGMAKGMTLADVRTLKSLLKPRKHASTLA